jgi:hypothetical protein
VLSGETKKIIVFGLTRSGIEPMIYLTRGVYANNHTTDAVLLIEVLVYLVQLRIKITIIESNPLPNMILLLDTITAIGNCRDFVGIHTPK